MSEAVPLSYYPPDHQHLRWAGFGAVGLHVLLVLVVAFLAWLYQVKSLRELMAEGGTIAQSGPAPEQQVEVLLIPEEEPPPPTVAPEFAREVIKPPPVPIPVVKPKVATKPNPLPKPKFTAAGATGQGESSSTSRLVVGSSGFPHPTYPFSARKARQTGTVLVTIQFDGGGNAAEVEVTQSSGINALDSGTRTFIRENWHDTAFAGRKCTVPVEYRLNATP